MKSEESDPEIKITNKIIHQVNFSVWFMSKCHGDLFDTYANNKTFRHLLKGSFAYRSRFLINIAYEYCKGQYDK